MDGPSTHAYMSNHEKYSLNESHVSDADRSFKIISILMLVAALYEFVHICIDNIFKQSIFIK